MGNPAYAQKQADAALLKQRADKKGAYQEKLIYAQYLLRQPTFEDQKLAVPYLQAVAKSLHPEYAPIAKQLLATPLVNRNFFQFSFEYPDAHYKLLRRYHDAGHITHEDMVKSLSSLLGHPLMSDRVRAKIYFQLVRINIELAKKHQQFAYLEEAIRYCEQLQNPSFAQTNKGQEAARIHAELVKERKIPRFLKIMGLSWEVMKDYIAVCRQWGKHVGIVLGNVLDLGLLLLPKVVCKPAMKYGWYKVDEHTFKSTSELRSIRAVDFLENAGCAWLFKEIGKKIGTGVGYLQAAITMVFAIPFSAIISIAGADGKTQKIAAKVKAMDKGQQPLASSTAATKKIFDHKEDQHVYKKLDGNEFSIQPHFLQKKKVPLIGDKLYPTLFAAPVAVEQAVLDITPPTMITVNIPASNSA